MRSVAVTGRAEQERLDPRLVRAPVHFPVGCALPVSSLTRAKSTILASSHVRPPSLDHDSS
jgi:hypothetical protein